MPKKFEEPAADAPIMRSGPRSQRAKLLGLVQGNPAFEGFNVNDKWTDAEFDAEIRNFMKSNRTQTVPRGGARIETPDE